MLSSVTLTSSLWAPFGFTRFANIVGLVHVYCSGSDAVSVHSLWLNVILKYLFPSSSVNTWLLGGSNIKACPQVNVGIKSHSSWVRGSPVSGFVNGCSAPSSNPFWLVSLKHKFNIASTVGAPCEPVYISSTLEPCTGTP